jgi:hypothetical protein
LSYNKAIPQKSGQDYKDKNNYSHRSGSNSRAFVGGIVDSSSNVGINASEE